MTGLELQELLSNSFETLGVDLNYYYSGKRPLDLLQTPVDTVEDLNLIPSAYRYKGMTVTVLSGETLNANGKNIPDEYWLVGGTKNSNWQKKPKVFAEKFSLSADTNNATIDLLYDGQKVGTAANLTEMLMSWQYDMYLVSGSVVTENDVNYLKLYYNDPTTPPIVIDLSGLGDGQGGGVGPRGPQGPQGPEGPQGPQGAQGADGQQGAQGAPGRDGRDGIEGAQGPAGRDGRDGQQGPQGAQGAEGPQGSQGAQGADGQQGPQGPQGPQGEAVTFEKGEGLSFEDNTLSVDKEFVREIAISAITDSLIPQNAKETLDTLQEIAEYIQNHPDEVSAYTEYVTEIRNSLSAMSANVEYEFAEVFTRIDQLTYELSGYTEEKINELSAETYSLSSVTSGLTVCVEQLQDTVAQLSGANENVIEEVQVDGVPLEVSAKSVNVPLSAYVEGRLSEYATSADTENAIERATASLSAQTYTDAKVLATADNVGKIIDVKEEDEVSGDTYSSGLYVVVGDNEISKLGLASATGDISGDVENLKGRVGTLESNVSNIMDYLYWETDEELVIE